VGSKSHQVAVDQDPQQVKKFWVYTKDHLLLIEHLRAHHISRFRPTTIQITRNIYDI
jgi:hypothetical protein